MSSGLSDDERIKNAIREMDMFLLQKVLELKDWDMQIKNKTISVNEVTQGTECRRDLSYRVAG